MKKLFFVLLAILISVPAFSYGYKIYSGEKDVATAGTRVQLSSSDIDYHSLLVCAKEENTGIIVVGGVDVIASQSTRNSTYLEAGDCRYYSGTKGDYNGNLSYHYLDSTVNGEGITYEYTIPYNKN